VIVKRTLVVMILLSTTLCASDKPRMKKEHNFFDAQNLMLQGANIAAQIADYQTTQRNLQLGFVEKNPIGQTGQSQIALKATGVGVSFGLSYFCHVVGWHKMERIVPIVVAVPTGIAIMHNVQMRRGK
jgi:hypothetical protein